MIKLSAFLLTTLLLSSSTFALVQDSAYMAESDSVDPSNVKGFSDTLTVEDTMTTIQCGEFRDAVIDKFTFIDNLSSDDIDNSIAESIGELLDMWSTIDIARKGSMGQPEIAIVGGHPRGLEILVDRVPFRQQDICFPQSAYLDLNTVLLSNVSSVKLLPSGLANMWGRGGGILSLDVRTKEFHGDEPYSRATANRGPHGSHRTQVELSRQVTSKGSFYFAAEFKESDGYQVNSDYDGTSLWGKGNFNLTRRTDLQLTAFRYRTKMGIFLFPDADHQDARKKVDNWGISSDMLVRENLHACLNLRLRYDKQNQEIKSAGYGFELQQNDEKIVLTATQTFEKHRSQIEIEGYAEKEVLSTLTTEDAVHSGYLSITDLYQLQPNLSLLLSSKIAKEEGLSPGISALTGVSYLISEQIGLFGTIGTFAAYPIPMDRYWPHFSFSFEDTLADYLEEGSNSLKSQRSLIADLGMNLKNKDLEISGYVFGSKIDDLVLWSNIDTMVYYGYFRPINTQAEIWGANVNSKFEFFDRFSLYVSYSYKQGRNSKMDLHLPCSPEHSLFGYVQFEDEFLKREIGLKLRLEAKVLSERFMDEYEKDKEPAAAIMNAKVTIRFLDFHFHYTIRNITNEEYRGSRYYSMPGRTYWWGFYWEFYD